MSKDYKPTKKQARRKAYIKRKKKELAAKMKLAKANKLQTEHSAETTEVSPADPKPASTE